MLRNITKITNRVRTLKNKVRVNKYKRKIVSRQVPTLQH
jgi:hypothetical protein